MGFIKEIDHKQTKAKRSAYIKLAAFAVDLRGEGAGRIGFLAYRDKVAADSGLVPYRLEQKEIDVTIKGAEAKVLSDAIGATSLVIQLFSGLPELADGSVDESGFVMPFTDEHGDTYINSYCVPCFYEVDVIGKQAKINFSIYASKALYLDGAPSFAQVRQYVIGGDHANPLLPNFTSFLAQLDAIGGRSAAYTHAKTKDKYKDAVDVLEE